MLLSARAPYRQVKVHRWTDRQMDRPRQLQYPFSLKGHGVKLIFDLIFALFRFKRGPKIRRQGPYFTVYTSLKVPLICLWTKFNGPIMRTLRKWPKSLKKWNFLPLLIIEFPDAGDGIFRLCGSNQCHACWCTGSWFFFLAVWPWNLTDDLEKQQSTSSTLLQALCIIS